MGVHPGSWDAPESLEVEGLLRAVRTTAGDRGAVRSVGIPEQGPPGRFQAVVQGVREVWQVEVGVDEAAGGWHNGYSVVSPLHSDTPASGSQRRPQPAVALLEPLFSCAKQGEAASFWELPRQRSGAPGNLFFLFAAVSRVRSGVPVPGSLGSPCRAKLSSHRGLSGPLPCIAADNRVTLMHFTTRGAFP